MSERILIVGPWRIGDAASVISVSNDFTVTCAWPKPLRDKKNNDNNAQKLISHS